jgi:GxxExxY protein
MHTPNVNEITSEVIGAAIEVHSELGPGLLEKIYQECLIHELHQRGFSVESELLIPVIYKGISIKHPYRLDLLVENTLIVEIKAVDSFHPIHKAQLLTYLKICKLPIGLLMNFNVPLLKQGIQRVILSSFFKK